jgi:CRP-like cAMP-binding protein
MGSEALIQKFGKELPAGTVLFKDGDTGKQMFVIQKGNIKISKQIGDQKKTLAILPAGEFFGEMAILNNEPRMATATVVEDCLLLVIDSKTFESMIRGNAEISLRMIKKLSERLKEADEQIENLLIKDNNSKVISTLAKMGENEGTQTEGGIVVKATTKNLSLKTGLDQDTISEILNKVIKAKLISIQSDSIIISDVTKLRKFLDFLTLKEQFGDLS